MMVWKYIKRGDKEGGGGGGGAALPWLYMFKG